MATPELRYRPKDDPSPATTAVSAKSRKDKRLAMARRGLRSLAIAVATPLVLTILVLSFLGSSRAHTRPSRPFWHPPEWAFHLASASCACLMGFAAWLAWADGGFHRLPEALPLYLAQLLMSLAWGPLLFRSGSGRAGLAASVGLVAALVGCTRCFRRVNPIAADLVKPCLAWAAFLVVFSLKVM